MHETEYEEMRPVTAYDMAVSGQLEASTTAPEWPTEPAAAHTPEPSVAEPVYAIATTEFLLQPQEQKAHVVQIPALKCAVVVRALTRAEALDLRKAGEMELAELERRLLAAALVQPKMTYAQAKTWYDMHGTDTLTPVLDKVLQVSGLTKGGKEALKEGMRTFRE